MSVVAEISVPAEQFELGRLAALPASGTVDLESLVPVGERAVPYLWVHDADFEAFEASVASDPAVESVERVDAAEDRALYALDWSVGNDAVFRSVRRASACVLQATGSDGAWRFELRFPSHDAVSTFRDGCRDAGVGFEVIRVYSPGDPGPGPWYGLTEPQREALVLAVRAGYYDIPRECATVELAERLGISDQAVTERLRRAIVRLVTNTVLTSPDD